MKDRKPLMFYSANPEDLILTPEALATIPTSLLLLDLMSHIGNCGGTCKHCAPKVIEIDRRIPIRNAKDPSNV